MDEAAKVREARARGEADAAKARLMGDVDDLKTRLAPGKLTSDAVQSAKDKSIVAADSAVAAVRAKPAVAAGAAGALGLLILRKPLWWSLKRLFRRRKSTTDTYDKSSRPRAASTER